MYARDVMTTDVISVGPETTIGEIAALLLQHRISAVPVIDDGNIVGIVSEGDLMRRPETDTVAASSPWLSLLTGPGVAPDRFSKAHGTTAREVMTRNVVTVTPETPLDEVAGVLESKRIKRVPVVEDGRLVGILSRANLLHVVPCALEKRSGATPGPVKSESHGEEAASVSVSGRRIRSPSLTMPTMFPSSMTGTALIRC